MKCFDPFVMSVPKFKYQILGSYTIIFAKKFTKFWFYLRKNYNWVCSAHRSRDTMYWRGGIIIHANVEKYFTEKLGQIITIADNAEAATWEESQY
jgi:hypothetical protein